MADVSDARQALRDYARERVETTEIAVLAGVVMPDREQVVQAKNGDRFIVGVRGELAGLAIVALQNVLALAEEGIATRSEIEAAVLKAFKR